MAVNIPNFRVTVLGTTAHDGPTNSLIRWAASKSTKMKFFVHFSSIIDPFLCYLIGRSQYADTSIFVSQGGIMHEAAGPQLDFKIASVQDFENNNRH